MSLSIISRSGDSVVYSIVHHFDGYPHYILILQLVFLEFEYHYTSYLTYVSFTARSCLHCEITVCIQCLIYCTLIHTHIHVNTHSHIHTHAHIQTHTGTHTNLYSRKESILAIALEYLLGMKRYYNISIYCNIY